MRGSAFLGLRKWFPQRSVEVTVAGIIFLGAYELLIQYFVFEKAFEHNYYFLDAN